MVMVQRKRNQNKPDAILTGDWHLRDTTPTCRTDVYWVAQEKKLRFICDMAMRYSIPILHSGDIFDNAKSSPFLEAWLIRHLRHNGGVNLIAIAGNHDLPNHSMQMITKSSVGVLEASGVVSLRHSIYKEQPKISGRIISRFHWDLKISQSEATPTDIALYHFFVTEDATTIPNIESERGIDLLKRLNYSLIVTGHNHQAFVVKYEGRLLVNPGSIMRMNADQADFQPRVYLWYADDNRVEAVHLPIEKDVVSREHLAKKEERDRRLDAFVSHLRDGYEVGLSFEKNVDAFFAANRTRKAVKDIVMEVME